MHYYQFNIADYRKDTQHLSPIEHFIYRELIDWYYLDENPIPRKTQVVMRRLRLVSENEQEVQNVLEEFFEETDFGWIHARIEREILAYQRKAEAAKANGIKGGRPKKPRKTQSVNLGSEKKPKGKLTNNHKPLTNSNNSPNGECGNSKSSPVPYQRIVDLYHQHLPKLPRVVKISTKRQRAIRARWKDDADNLEYWEAYFKHAATSKFLHGQNDRGWTADIDFLTREDVMIKMQEGKYHG